MLIAPETWSPEGDRRGEKIIGSEGELSLPSLSWNSSSLSFLPFRRDLRERNKRRKRIEEELCVFENK